MVNLTKKSHPKLKLFWICLGSDYRLNAAQQDEYNDWIQNKNSISNNLRSELFDQVEIPRHKAREPAELPELDWLHKDVEVLRQLKEISWKKSGTYSRKLFLIN